MRADPAWTNPALARSARVANFAFPGSFPRLDTKLNRLSLHSLLVVLSLPLFIVGLIGIGREGVRV
jgi:hypothetical protein